MIPEKENEKIFLMRKIDEVQMKFSIETTFNFLQQREMQKKENSIVIEKTSLFIKRV
jgi:hypothetical protein